MTKRKSFLRQFFNYWGLWALMALAATAFAVTMARVDATNAARLATEGADAQATVTGLNMTTTRSNNRTQHHYEVSFSFTVDGTTHEGKKIVSEAFYRALKTRDIIPVRYWTQDPSLTEVEPGLRATQARIGRIVAGVAAVVTLIFATLGWRWAAAARWMVRHGIPRETTVTRLAGSWFNVGKNSYYRAVWQDAQGETRSRRHRIKRIPGVGTKVTILTDPAGLRPSLWEGDL